MRDVFLGCVRPPRSLIAIWLLLFCGFTAAECGINRDILGASYRIERRAQPQGTVRLESLKLWRLHDAVAHERPERGYTDIWRKLGGGELEHKRFSESRRRLIASETVSKADALWSSKYQLLPQKALDEMSLIEHSGEGCKRVEKYRVEITAGVLTVWWNPYLRLVMLLHREGADASTTMEMTGLETVGPAIAKAFNLRQFHPSGPSE